MRTYLLERKRIHMPDRWRVVGEFVEGTPWRDGRPVGDATMQEEVKGYRRAWPRYEARVWSPDGELLEE